MKYFRATAMVLILALTSSLALADICATSCASHSIISSMHSEDMAGMKNCHEGSMNKEKSKANTEHKSCAMGAGCQFTQVTPIVLPAQYVFTASASIAFPSFVPFEKSVDPSPPLKPPA
jgi:hypothetical protein